MDRGIAAISVTDPFDLLIEGADVRTVLQPIVDGVCCRPHGFEALSRGPIDSSLESPAALFTEAALQGRTRDLEELCLRSALEHYAALRVEGKLFVNILPMTLLGWPSFPGWLRKQLTRCAIAPQSLVLELTEHGTQQDEAPLAAAVAPLRALGCEIAIDDLGAGVSGLKTWSAIRPEYVKVDGYFVAGIEGDSVRAEILRALVEMGRATCSRIVAEGIEKRAQYNIVRELGVDYVQGYFIGRPAPEPRVEFVAADTPASGSTGAVAVECAEDLSRPIVPVQASTRVADVLARFQAEPNLTGVAVVDGLRPIGLIRRDALLILYSKPLHAEIYARKPATSVMDADPVKVDSRARLEQVSRLLTSQDESRQREDFIITRGGKYLGLGRSMELLRQITTQQLQIARHSNPLTGLPGNRQIQTELQRLVARRQSFVACHLDLDYFKPFNDTYGYSRGDAVLLHVAQSISRRAQSRGDFVGHVGGDDFVFFLCSQDWAARITQLLRDLSESMPAFHSIEHRKAGGYSALARDGRPTRYPLLGASIGAMEIGDEDGTTVEEVGEGLRQAKAAAKASGGNTCIISRGEYLINLITQQELPELPVGDTVVIRAALKRLAAL